MTTPQSLYNQLLKEEITPNQFMYHIRRDPKLSNYINNHLNLKDTIQILKNKSIISENTDINKHLDKSGLTSSERSEVSKKIKEMGLTGDLEIKKAIGDFINTKVKSNLTKGFVKENEEKPEIELPSNIDALIDQMIKQGKTKEEIVKAISDMMDEAFKENEDEKLNEGEDDDDKFWKGDTGEDIEEIAIRLANNRQFCKEQGIADDSIKERISYLLDNFDAEDLEEFEAEMNESMNEAYMGNKGEEYMISPHGRKDNEQTTYVLEKPDGSAQIDMFFSSADEARKYADKKGLIVVDKNNINENNYSVNDKSLSYSDLEKGRTYYWTGGAEILPIKYIGLASRNPDKKAGSSIGKGFLFQWVENGKYFEMSNDTIRKDVKELETPDVNPSGELYESSLSYILSEAKKSNKKNKLKGGKGDKLTVDQVNPEELRAGIRIEMEHTTDPEVAKEIALDHLSEDPNYYTHLKAMEGEYNKKTIKDKKKNRTDLMTLLDDKLKNVIDKENGMKYVSNEKLKSNVKFTLSDKEAKTGAPKKVKEMGVKPQRTKGVKFIGMPSAGKKVKLSELLDTRPKITENTPFGHYDDNVDNPPKSEYKSSYDKQKVKDFVYKIKSGAGWTTDNYIINFGKYNELGDNEQYVAMLALAKLGLLYDEENLEDDVNPNEDAKVDQKWVQDNYGHISDIQPKSKIAENNDDYLSEDELDEAFNPTNEKEAQPKLDLNPKLTKAADTNEKPKYPSGEKKFGNVPTEFKLKMTNKLIQAYFDAPEKIFSIQKELSWYLNRFEAEKKKGNTEIKGKNIDEIIDEYKKAIEFIKTQSSKSPIKENTEGSEYWKQYEKSHYSGDKKHEAKITDKSKLQDAIKYAVNYWNRNADDPLDKILYNDASYITKPASEFMDDFGYININILKAMLAQL